MTFYPLSEYTQETIYPRAWRMGLGESEGLKFSGSRRDLIKTLCDRSSGGGTTIVRIVHSPSRTRVNDLIAKFWLIPKCARTRRTGNKCRYGLLQPTRGVLVSFHGVPILHPKWETPTAITPSSREQGSGPMSWTEPGTGVSWVKRETSE